MICCVFCGVIDCTICVYIDIGSQDDVPTAALHEIPSVAFDIDSDSSLSPILSQQAGGSQHEAESNKLSNDTVSSDESESNSEDSGFGRTKGADPRGDKLEVKCDVYSDSETESESDCGVPTRGAIIRSPSIKYHSNPMIHIPDVSEIEPVKVDNSNMQMNVVEGTIHLMYLFVCDMRSLLSFFFSFFDR